MRTAQIIEDEALNPATNAGASKGDEATCQGGHCPASHGHACRPLCGCHCVGAICSESAVGESLLKFGAQCTVVDKMPVLALAWLAALRSTCRPCRVHKAEQQLVCSQSGPDALKLLGPFSNVIEGVIRDPFIRNWLDLLCFLLSGAGGKPPCCLAMPRT